MCIAVPMKVVEINDEKNTGIVESSGVKREIGLQLMDDIKVNDWVIVHTGFAISRLEEKEAQETLSLLKAGGFIE
ncbi:MAG: HypC/HybG/HupF family hydrogenase formation chaperone [Candidatus Aminicenantes bacterium]|nr:HypC/HybG/HupF family hydrogenase formation chaperone [Candidatus Aminicenantes bacterium]NIM77654.1 HypC/HybG/HupF family hydrogenase formation chaperone [Candidatus Aminicenantes bacterium]NIN16966.1 HypC/HybG/HupF family hydrogenase formation chaperone [Candidatus Aminicenantes bacterium]NIN40859.1 HypC/HybG/HupF family hydrogenase formation chaperone [Candidatus Aminicenantes bacterium]NIN83663.1 HypC/HybG/HupF family hydrogenase formation chaperone [Candidatus Aminicenantes bacterium]